MKIVLPLCCFPPIEYLILLHQASDVVICLGEYFVKQTHRSRYEIATSNGKLLLSIPVSGSKNHRNISEMEINYRENWQLIHWKSLISAYRHSPFFDHYEFELKKLIFSNEKLLIDFSLKTLHFIEKSFKVKFYYQVMNEFNTIYEEYADLRNYDFSGQIVRNLPHYIQPFSHKTNFIPNLSSLDLLFCENKLNILN